LMGNLPDTPDLYGRWVSNLVNFVVVSIGLHGLGRGFVQGFAFTKKSTWNHSVFAGAAAFGSS
jgi:hypothetical protein